MFVNIMNSQYIYSHFCTKSDEAKVPDRRSDALPGMWPITDFLETPIANRILIFENASQISLEYVMLIVFQTLFLGQ